MRVLIQQHHYIILEFLPQKIPVIEIKKKKRKVYGYFQEKKFNSKNNEPPLDQQLIKLHSIMH